MKSLLPAPLVVASLLSCLLLAAPASADEPEKPDWYTKPNERRAGVVLGLGGGFGVGAASGYPNKATQIGDPAFYASSGLGLGSSGTLFLMGALTDYLNFGIWFGGGSSKTADWKTSSGGAGFRIEAFPLYGVSPRLRDLGISAQLGLGATKIESVRGTHPGAEGVQSYVGVGAFYEWRIVGIFTGHLAGGPSIDYSAAFSRSADRHDFNIGGRLVLYTAL